MECTINLTKSQGEFCHWIVNNDEYGRLNVGPDYVRLNRRYELFNGQHDVNSFVKHLRNMSYLMIIGANDETT
jgi:hypothetical protein